MQYNYAQYEKTKQSTNAGGKNFPKTYFFSDFLKSDGDTVVVRFPYKTMDDLLFESTHEITFPGEKWPKRVRCEGENCPLCKQGVKVSTRFFVKAIGYVVDDATGKVNLLPLVWDRPAAFADIDIKNLMQEYGDISQQLFKVKRNGTGTNTRYTMSVIVNTTVYNPAVYVADFSSIEQTDPVKIMTKTVDQYFKALNPNSTAANEQVDSTPQSQVNSTAYSNEIPSNAPTINPNQVYQNEVPFEEPYTNVNANSSTEPVRRTVYSDTPQVGTPNAAPAPKRYTF